MLHRSTLLFILFFSMFTALFTGCASTSIRDVWSNAEYRGAPFSRILVLNTHGTIAERRIIEDVVSHAIDVTGSHGIPGYRYLPRKLETGSLNVSKELEAAHADALLLIQLKSIEIRIQASVPPPMIFQPGFYGGYGGYGYGWYGWNEASVYQYDVATIEIVLREAKTDQLIWTGTAETINPRPVSKTAPELAEQIVTALQAQKLLPGSNQKN